MSRTWQAHSRGDQTCGERRQLTSGVLEMPSAQPAELARTMSATFSARISPGVHPALGTGSIENPRPAFAVRNDLDQLDGS